MTETDQINRLRQLAKLAADDEGREALAAAIRAAAERPEPGPGPLDRAIEALADDGATLDDVIDAFEGPRPKAVPAGHYQGVEFPPAILRAGNGLHSGALLVPNEILLLSGPGGAMKSCLAVTTCVAVSNGMSALAGLFDSDAGGGPALYATFEDAPEVVGWRTLQHVGGSVGSDSNTHVLDMRGRALYGRGDRFGPIGPLDGWRDLWREADRINPRLIVIDPVLAAFGGEPNSVGDARAFLNALTTRCRALDRCGILAISHSNKAARLKGADPYDPGHVGGSAGWVDGVRGVVTLGMSGDDRALRISKANYGPVRHFARLAPIVTATGGVPVGLRMQDGAKWLAGEGNADGVVEEESYE